ncbi:oxygen-dependent tRNA uridine(34) hydroxylase TrhO [Rickettsiella massiliensis]|uniref:oxygen-dependent tRNA uridine(34) hydroxylase TrhO n=1 Tax=Rickettsiella massiliensis TaxID=676517 RepID=UPI00029AE54E|nr:rhodanese-like domain-containing protein [Rickettsiella massiliensis]
MSTITNISAYRFVSLPKPFLNELQNTLKKETQRLSLKGTILLSTEGINLFMAGEKRAIAEFQRFLTHFSYFTDLFFKESFSDFIPFKKMLIKIKAEIIAFGVENIQPEKVTAPNLAPETLKKWLNEQSEVVLLDTRNTFEVQCGSFEKSIHLDLKHFREFPDAVQKIPQNLKKVPIVTFCTGGIRCEKASALLLNAGFEKVYQLEGGILNYFEKCGSAHYRGHCFVFDERIALTPTLAAVTEESESASLK